MLLEEFLKKQNRALLRDFTGSEAWCLVAVSHEKLTWLQDYEDWMVESLPKCLLSNAFVVHKTPNFEPECWVRWNYSGYRRAFAIFLQVHYPKFASILNESVHVDHLEPKYRFEVDAKYYVRLHLVSKEVNSGYGAGFERSFYQYERKKEPKDAIHMSWVAYCKARGIRPPGKNAGVHTWDKWARERATEFAHESGESASQAYVGFFIVLQLGYTGYYSGEANKSLDTEKLIQAFEERAKHRDHQLCRPE